MIALTYNEYLQRYGASREAMAAVLVEARKNGARIPWSYWYGQPLTAQDYLDAPLINDPICRFDCDIPVDGVAAFLFTSAERAHDLPHRPVYVSGYAIGPRRPRRLPMHWPLDDIMGVGAETAARLWESAGVGPDDIDLPQLYDGFSPFIYFWLEVLGFCPPGEAHRFVQDGGIDSDRPDCAADPVRRRRPRQRADARRSADAGVLPAAVAASRASASANAPKSALPATPRPTSVAPSSTARILRRSKSCSPRQQFFSRHRANSRWSNSTSSRPGRESY